MMVVEKVCGDISGVVVDNISNIISKMIKKINVEIYINIKTSLLRVASLGGVGVDVANIRAYLL